MASASVARGATPLTLPDYLRPGLKLVFVGLNPGLYSANVGQYFARKTNRFWSALSAANVLGTNLKPGDEKHLFERGVGFTDVVKRATPSIKELTREEIAEGARRLRRKIEKISPDVACFIGLKGFEWVFGIPARVGPQNHRIGSTHIYVLPSTSGANAHVSSEQIVEAFRRLKFWLHDVGITF